MRILLTADPEIPVPPKFYGGVERIVASLAVALSRLGHEVGLVAHPESDPSLAIQMFSWPAPSSQHWRDTFANTAALCKAVRSFRPEVIHSFSRLMYLLPWLWNSIPKIMSFQRSPTANTVRNAARMGGKSLFFTGCSDMISESGRRGGGNWRTIHNFVDLDKFQFSPNVPADAPLVFLSRIERIKGAHTAVAACRQAGRRLVIAGNHADDDSENGRYWRNEIAPHLGQDGIEYVGPVDDVQKNVLLGEAAALIVPIEWEEPFGIVFVEALACGTPVISCPRGALPEIVRQGVDGFLSTSLAEMCEAIAKLPTLNRIDCRNGVKAAFAADVIVAKYLRLYRSLLVNS